MGIPITILLIEDSEDDALFLLRELRKGGYDPDYQRVDNLDELSTALVRKNWDIVITDYSLPSFSGIAALEIVKKQERYIPAIMVSGKMGETAAVEAMKAGANDYIIKGNYTRLIPAIERELREAIVHRERQAALEELRRSETRYRAVVEDQTELINRYTPDGVITFANTGYARLFDLTPEEIIGMHQEEFLSKESYAALQDFCSKLSIETPIMVSEHRHTTRNGEIVWLQWHDRIIFDNAGNFVEYQGVGRDITELKNAEIELKTFANNLERYATQLQVAAEIARDAATASNLDSLLKRAVDLVREHFGFYHAAVFLLDDAGEFAVLETASGESGALLLEQKHKLKVGKVGIVGHVAMSGQPRIALDVGKDATHFRQPLLPYTRSELAVPLKIMDRIIGVFDVQSHLEAAFDGNDLIVLQTMADQLAIAIDNMRLVQETKRRTEELAGLYDIALATNGVLDTQQLLHHLYEYVRKLIDSDAFSVALYTPNSREYKLVMAMENNEPVTEFLGKMYPISSGFTGWVLREGKPLLIGDILNDSLPIQPIQGAEPIRSWLGVPLIARDQLIGNVSIQSFRPNVFDISHQRFLESLASQVAIALENARLFEAERFAREQAETIREVAQVVGTSLEPQEILELILGQLKRVLEFDTASVLLFEDHGQPAFTAVIGYDETELVRTQSGLLLEESKILSKMADDLQPVIINDVNQSPDWIWVPGAEHVRSFMGVPVFKRNAMIGTLMVDSSQPNHFTQDDLKTVLSLTQHISIAIENAQLFEAERIARERAEALRDAAQVVGSSLSLDEIIETVLEQLERVLPYDSACVILVEGKYARVRAGRGYEKFTTSGNLSSITLPGTSRYVEEVVNQGKVLVIPDVHEYPDWVATPISEHVRSNLGLPLKVRDQVIGFFSIDRVTPHSFDDSDIEIGQMFTAQTSAAIENARLFEAEERQVAELESLRQVSLGLTSSLEPQSVLEAILEGVFRLIPSVEDAHIFVYDNERLIFGSALWQDGRRGEVFSFPRKEGLTYTVAKTGETMVVDNFQTHPLFKKVAAEKNWTGSIVGMPVKIGERVVGVLNVAHPEIAAFSETELRTLRLLGDQAALAIENARLFEQTIQERRHVALLYGIGQAMAATLIPDTILERALELTCRALGGQVGSVWVYLPEIEKLNLRVIFNQGIVPLETLGAEKDSTIDLGFGLIGQSAKNIQAINEPDIQKNEHWTDIPYIGTELHAAIAAPITEGKHLLGAMIILHEQLAAFNDDHLELIQTICQQIGLALSNARRYQDINRLVDLLAAEQYRLESLIEMLPVGVLLLDQQYRLLVTNPLGRKLLAALSPDLEDNPLTRLGNMPLSQLLAYQDATIPMEISSDEPDGGTYEVQARPIGGETVQWVLTLREVTQEREIQERIQMQNRLATVGQLAAGIAHDFNNIMAAIVVYADLLLMDPALSGASQDRLATIQQQVQRASSLIRQILDFSRRSVMEQNSLDLLPFMKEMEKLLKRTLPETVRLELIYESGEYFVMADLTRLQQVFMNLAVNARDAMIDGGTLQFHLAKVKFTNDDILPVVDMPPGNWVRVSIIDTGVGIPAENLSHIFEPFYTTKPVGQGTGLGLAQVYGIVRQHEGFIDVKSQLGEGTRFDIYLPVLSTHLNDAHAQDDQIAVDGFGEAVLIVEDDATTLTALQALLDAHNFTVLVASNGTEAIKRLDETNEAITLVISDIVMPEMGGMDLYTIIKIKWPEIKMIFITGHPLDGQAQDVLEKGSVVWLQKPFSIAEFNRAVKKVFS